ncbi:hypothetical protein ACFV8T_30415 [Streptomyces sp. NPDC059832]|uniref:hypothetical protein n=1 Tax=Streptomyces sp. NPDC059832 TaxID=3346966 RepID=UPI0036614D03
MRCFGWESLPPTRLRAGRTVSALTGGLTLGRLFTTGATLGVADVSASTSASALVPEAGRQRANA